MEKKRYEKPFVETIDVQWNDCIAAASGIENINSIEILGGEKVNHYKWFGSGNNQGEGAWLKDSF